VQCPPTCGLSTAEPGANPSAPQSRYIPEDKENSAEVPVECLAPWIESYLEMSNHRAEITRFNRGPMLAPNRKQARETLMLRRRFRASLYGLFLLAVLAISAASALAQSGGAVLYNGIVL